MELDFKHAGFCLSVIGLLMGFRQCSLLPSLANRLAVITSASDVANNAASLGENQPTFGKFSSLYYTATAEHIQDSAVKERAEYIPADGRIWRSQQSKVRLTDRRGAKVRFFAARVLMYDGQNVQRLENAFEIPDFELLPNQTREITLTFPERIINQANKNWSDAPDELKIERIHTFLVGEDDHKNEVMVNIETGEAKINPPPNASGSYF